MRSSPVLVRRTSRRSPGLPLQGADELVALAFRPGIGAVDQPGQVLDEPLAHRFVTGGGIRVVAHHEPLRARPLVVAAAGCHPDFFDPQVVGPVVVTAGAGQRGGGLGVGVAQLLGVEVVPAAAGEVGAVGGRGEAGIDDPHQPVQLPRPQIVGTVRMIRWSLSLPGKVQQRTGMPSRVTAIAITT